MTVPLLDSCTVTSVVLSDRTAENLARQMRSLWLNRDSRGPCRSPFTHKVDGLAMVLPCGSCLPCREKRLKNIIGRDAAQASINPGSFVMTLTYDDKHLPPDEALTHPEFMPSEWDAFRNRLKRRLGPFKYRAVAQIGENTLRFHWHVAIFPASLERLAFVVKSKRWLKADGLWPMGHRMVDALSPQTSRYISQYLTKSGKGTVWHSKSQMIGESYFRDWLTKPKPPFIQPGRAVFDVNSIPYPMDRRFRQIAAEAGWLVADPHDAAQRLSDWYQDRVNGYLSAAISAAKDRDAQAKRAAVVHRKPLRTEFEILTDQIREGNKRARSLRSPRENAVRYG